MQFVDPEMIRQIYPSEPDIVFIDGQDFKNKLDERRSEKYSYDKKAIEGDGVKIDIDSANEIPEGRVRIDYDGVRFESFFHKGKQKRLYVMFPASRSLKNGTLRDIPVFPRWSWYNFTDAYWFSFEDPMFFDCDKILTGWLYGTSDKNYREYAARIIKKICDLYSIPYDETFFYGSSAGGTAAIHTAALFGKGTVISINAQYDFQTGSETDKRLYADLERNLGIDVHKPDKFRRNDICGILRSSLDISFVIIENIRSLRERIHLSYLTNKLDMEPRYGLSRFDNIYFYLYDARGNNPHVASEDKNLFYAVNFLAYLAKNRQDIESYQHLYLLFGEFWYDKYVNQMTSEKNASPGITLLDENILSSKGQPMPVMDYLQNIYIKPVDDNYNCFALDLRKCVTQNIELRGTFSQTGAQKYTVALIDFDSMTFIFNRTCTIGEPAKFSFMVGNTDHKLSLCIFAGKYGETAGHDIGIREIIMRWE